MQPTSMILRITTRMARSRRFDNVITTSGCAKVTVTVYRDRVQEPQPLFIA